MTIVNRKLWRVTVDEFLMGRDKQAPLTPEMEQNMEKLLIAVNLIRDLYGKPLTITSGYRPAAINAAAGGSKKSNHMSCLAVDFADKDRKLTNWCLKNLDILAEAGLYMESPLDAPSWVHLQVVAPGSGRRVFRA